MSGKALRYDGKVAVVTGAGGGLGRAYALYLGSRGAKVVVNDLGGSTFGDGADNRPAIKVCEEIAAAGGEAIPNFDSVVDGDKVVQTAIDKWGRVDILINNAGILRDVSFAKMTDKDWNLIFDVHVKGAYKTTKAAWPYMRENRYGRIVNVTSAAGLYGNFGQANYSSAKLGIVGLTQTLSIEGNSRNIKANVIAPLAGSRMTETVMPKQMVEALKPDYVAPLVAFLAHEDCEEAGSIFEVGAGWIAKLRWQRTAGAFFDLSKEFTVEDVAARIGEIGDFDNDEVEYPDSTASSMGAVLKQIETLKAKL